MFKKLFKAEGGFTLVELLVTIAILGVLFGIVSLTLSGVGTNAKTTICASETAVVQSAMDIWLAKTAGNAFAGQPVAAQIVGDTITGVYTDYLRGTTKGFYTYSANGASLLQTSCP